MMTIVSEENEMTTYTYLIDPPSGWQYGFPKVCPIEVYDQGGEAIIDWMIKEGYPESVTKTGWFYWRTIIKEDQGDSAES